MPILYTKDDTRRCLTFTVVGELSGEDLVAAADRQGREGVWSYGVLLDARDRTGEAVTTTMVRAFVEHNEMLTLRHGMPGPFAIVPRDPAGYGMGRMFEMLTGANSTRAIAVFRLIEEATAWLDAPRAGNPELDPIPSDG